MYLEMFLRIFSDCCIFFALLGCCPSILPYSYPLIAVALICGVAAGIAAFLRSREKYIPAYFCAALPFLSLLLANGWQEMLILILPLLYTAGIIVADKMYLEYFGYRQFLKYATAFLLIVWAMVSLAVFLEDPRGLEEKVVFTDDILKYTGIYFLSGVILQRKLRLGTGRSHGNLGQIVTMAGSVGVICGGFFLTEPMLVDGIHELFKKVGPMILAPIMIVAEYVQMLSDKATEWMKSTGYDEEAYRQEVMDEGSPSLPVGFPDGTEDIPPEAVEPGHNPWPLIIAVVAALAAIGLMLYAYARWREKQTSSLTVAKVADGTKSKQKAQLSNRKKVRQMYREFLRLEQKRGTVIKPRHTTADILSRVFQKTDRDAATKLRQVYIGARYDESREVNRAQVDAARNAIKLIRKEVTES